MAVKQGAVNDFMAYVNVSLALPRFEPNATSSSYTLTIADSLTLQNYFPKTVFGEPCRSWYKAGKEIGFAMPPTPSARRG